mgnify:CR=1 FL=1
MDKEFVLAYVDDEWIKWKDAEELATVRDVDEAENLEESYYNSCKGEFNYGEYYDE